MASPLPVLINRAAGAAAALGEQLEPTIREAFAEVGRAIHLELLDAADFAEAVRRHAQAPVVVVGGGDGTLGAAANAVVGTRTALGVLPLGTHNRLASQLDIPPDLSEAARVAATGERRRIDLGRAGTRAFINNVAIGRPVLAPDERGWAAAWSVLRAMRPRSHCLTVDGEDRVVRTPLLVVGNSRPLHQPSRRVERDLVLDDDLLLCAARPHGVLQSVWFAVTVLLGLARTESEVVELSPTRSVTVHGSGELEVVIDGEPYPMARPLQIGTLPSALGVVVPRVKAEQEVYLYRIH